MLMNIGGIQMTFFATYAPSRTDDPPGTIRTPLEVENGCVGKVSLSRKVNSDGSERSVTTPIRNASRIPRLTHRLTRQPVLLFSAARNSPRFNPARNSA